MSPLSNGPDDPASVYKEALGGIGLRYAPCVPVKQGSANLVFQLGNGPTDRSLRTSNRSSCFTKTAVLDHSHEIPEMAKLDSIRTLDPFPHYAATLLLVANINV